MASYYWIKLYHEILDDAKMGRLRDRLWRRTIECFLMAGEVNKGGWLPSLEDMAWRLRADLETLEGELRELEEVEILEEREGRWFVANFEERQSADSSAERVRRYRERKRKREYYDNGTPPEPSSNEAVTFRYTDIDKDKEIDIDEIRAPVRAFCEHTNRPLPDLEPDEEIAVKAWMNPACYFLSLSGWDKSAGSGLVRQTLSYMDENGLSYKNLGSLVNVARTVKNARASPNGSGRDEPELQVDENGVY